MFMRVSVCVGCILFSDMQVCAAGEIVDGFDMYGMDCECADEVKWFV